MAILASAEVDSFPGIDRARLFFCYARKIGSVLAEMPFAQ